MKKKLSFFLLSLLFLTLFSVSLQAQWFKTPWDQNIAYARLLSVQDKVIARVWDSEEGNRSYVTPDRGMSWALTNSLGQELEVLSVVSLSNTLLAGTWDALYVAAFDGQVWNRVFPAGMAESGPVWALLKSDNQIFAGGTGALFVSSDNGNSWSNGAIDMADSSRIMCFASDSHLLLAGSDSEGVFISSDAGASWEQANTGLGDLRMTQLLISGSRIFALTLKGLFISDNRGQTWAADTSGLKNINCLVLADNKLFAGTEAKGVYSSSNNGLAWTAVNSGLPEKTSVWSLAINYSSLFAGTSSGIWRLDLDVEAVLGDVNGDNFVNIVDALLIAQFYVGIDAAVFIEANADVDCNNAINIVDALLIAQFYVKLIPELSCQ
ncbi:MAG: hypothetical protein JXR70_04870 [Spirochaetales bacterium]|nr:hypothetical protein [Spirochaetales bacterium]